MKRYRSHKADWGEFVDVKINGPHILGKSIQRKSKGLVLLSSVTDPYQPQEEKYKLTRQCLQMLHQHQFPVSILTKSSLVIRDIDILRYMENIEVGFTITTLDEGIRQHFEPQASPIHTRLSALKKLADENITTFVFLGPMLPYLSDKSINGLIEKLADLQVDHILIDRLNPRQGTWSRIKKVLQKEYPQLIDRFQHALYNKSYFEELKPRISAHCKENSLSYEFCY
jgi:DNA repair photolyase